MKTILFLVAACFAFASCQTNVKNEATAQAQKEVAVSDHVEVLYFHGKQRCATCMAIEKNTKDVIETQFADELENGTVIFRIIDISEPENEKIADKYEVTWSSLFVSQWKDGKETYENLTEYAFANARTSPETFKSGLTEKINELLK